MNPFSYNRVAAAIVAVALGLVGPGASAAPIPPTAPPAADDIVDIRPPIHIAAPFSWLALSAGALGLAGIGATAWILRRRRQRKLAYEIALERLENARRLMLQESAEPFCRAVSEIVRLFIEEVLPVRAVHRTTNEFLRELASLSYVPLTEYRNTLADFLRHCDLAKFARWSLTVPQMEAILQSAKAFVTALGQPEPTSEQQAGGTNQVAHNQHSLTP